MPIHFEYDADHHFMLVIMHGVVTDSELQAHIDRLLDDEYKRPGAHCLVLLCKGGFSGKVTYRSLMQAGLRMHQAEFRQQGKLAIVANSSVTFGLSRIYEAAASMQDMDEVCVVYADELESMIQWLGVDELSAQIHERMSLCDQNGDETTLP